MDKETKQNSFIVSFIVLSIVGLSVYLYVANVSRWDAMSYAEEQAKLSYPDTEEPYFRRQYVRDVVPDAFVVCGEIAETARGPFRRYHFITIEDLFLIEPVDAIIAGKPTLQLKSFNDSWATHCERKAG